MDSKIVNFNSACFQVDLRKMWDSNGPTVKKPRPMVCVLAPVFLQSNWFDLVFGQLVLYDFINFYHHLL